MRESAFFCIGQQFPRRRAHGELTSARVELNFISAKARSRWRGRYAIVSRDGFGWAGWRMGLLNARLFPQEIQKSVFLDSARSAAMRVVIRSDDPDEADEARLDKNDSLVASRIAELGAKALPPNLSADHVHDIATLWQDDLVKLLEEWRVPFASNFPRDLTALAQLGIFEVFKDPGKQMGTTGLVFAGFGDHDIFPAFSEYRSCSIVAGKHVAMEMSQVAITYDTPAWLDSFAQTDMCDTFSMGISRDVYISVMKAMNDGLSSFVKNNMGAAAGDGMTPDLRGAIEKALSDMGDAFMAEARREHAVPMRRVLGVLPVDEMADLAETLINLQSLKEKVTKKSETVGGPVDVAIITKNEGFLWAKRKHFFDIELNSRFALRQQARLV